MREYLAYALIVGIGLEEARHLMPGFIMDMYVIRAKHDVRVNWGNAKRKLGL